MPIADALNIFGTLNIATFTLATAWGMFIARDFAARVETNLYDTGQVYHGSAQTIAVLSITVMLFTVRLIGFLRLLEMLV